jgi:hypothetical protein
LYRATGEDVYALRDFFAQQPEVTSTQLFGDAVHVSFFQKPEPALWDGWMQQTRGLLKQWHSQTPSIEDVFMDVVGATP